MALKVLNDYVLVEPDPNEPVLEGASLEAVKSGLIVLPEHNTVEKVSNTGTVLGRGPKCHYPFQHGQRVLFDRFSGLSFVHEGKKLKFLRELDVEAVYES